MLPRRAAVALVCLLLLVPFGCGQTAPTTPKIPRAVLRIVCEVPDAKVWVDERYIGPVRAMPGGMRLAAGEHRVEVRHDRFHTRYLEVNLVPNEVKTVEVTLAEALP